MNDLDTISSRRTSVTGRMVCIHARDPAAVLTLPKGPPLKPCMAAGCVADPRALNSSCTRSQAGPKPVSVTGGHSDSDNDRW